MFFFSDNASPSSEDSGSTQAGVESLTKDENDQTSEPNDVSLLFKSNCAVFTLQQDWGHVQRSMYPIYFITIKFTTCRNVTIITFAHRLI